MSPALVERLCSADPAERRRACLDAIDDPSATLLLGPLCDTLADPDRRVARAASDALAALGRADRAADTELRRVLRGTDPRGRWGAAFTLARLAPPEPGLLPAVVEAMGSADGDVRWAAARLLVDIGRLHPEVLQLAVGLARSGDDPAVRRMAAFCLRELAPDHPGAASALLVACDDDDRALRRAAFSALAALVTPPPEVWRRLLAALEADPDPTVPRLAAVGLGELGARAGAALPEAVGPALARARDRAADAHLARAAERALARIASPRTGGREAHGA